MIMDAPLVKGFVIKMRINPDVDCIRAVDFRGRGQAELDWRNVDTVLLWGINIQASLKVIFWHILHAPLEVYI